MGDETTNVSKEALNLAFKVASLLTGGKVTNEDLSELLQDKEDLSSDSAYQIIKPKLIAARDENKSELVGKGLRKGAQKAENLLSEVFHEIEFAGNLEDRIMKIREFSAKNSKKTDKSKIGLDAALQSEEVRNHIASFKAKADKYDELNNEFSMYKRNQGLKQKAIDWYTANGYELDSNSTIRKFQIQALEDHFNKLNFKEENDSIILLNSEGERKYDDQTNDFLSFDTYLSRISPFKKVALSDKKIDKTNTPYPDNNNGGKDNRFGYSKNHKFSADDYKLALQQNNLGEAKFIEGELLKQAEASQQKG